jgi:hypothetical protein
VVPGLHDDWVEQAGEEEGHPGPHGRLHGAGRNARSKAVLRCEPRDEQYEGLVCQMYSIHSPQCGGRQCDTGQERRATTTARLFYFNTCILHLIGIFPS